MAREVVDGLVSAEDVGDKAELLGLGDREAIEQFVDRRTEEGVFCRRVDVDYASHSAQVDGILGELKEALHGVQPRAASVGMFSTVTGDPLEGTELDAEYWCRNLRQPVRLDRGLAAVLGQGHGVFIEVSAHPVLAMPLTTAFKVAGSPNSAKKACRGADAYPQMKTREAACAALPRSQPAPNG